ncbi:MAG TPA: hypothetical protein VF460_11085 [Burkholderiales bacterium]
MIRMLVRVALTAMLLALAVSVRADQQARAGYQGATEEHHGVVPQLGDAERPTDPKAQSGAEAADEARIYTARLRQCEGFQGAQREACVDAAKRRLGEL